MQASPTKVSVAYDLAAYEKQMKTRGEGLQLVKNSRLRQRRQQRWATLRTIIICAALCAVCIAQLIVGASINEVSGEIRSLRKEKNRLDGEIERLTVVYNQTIDLDQVEKLALYEYGMVKMESDQVEYIRFHETDEAEVLDGTGAEQNIFYGLADTVRSVVEYLG